MKNLMIVLLMLPLFSMAEGRGGKAYFASINIHSQAGCNYEVIINGVAYDLRTELNLYDLRPGQHYIEVVEHRVNRRGYGNVRTIYQGDVFLPHGSVLNACINRNGNFVISDIIRPRTQHYCVSNCRLRHAHYYAPARPIRSAVQARRGRTCGRW